MRTANVSDLAGVHLDWAVAKQEDPLLTVGTFVDGWEQYIYAGSVDWQTAGPIIEREKINMECPRGSQWVANVWSDGKFFVECGETPIVAAMRCYIRLKAGTEIEMPEELV